MVSVRPSRLNPPDLSWAAIGRDLAMGVQDVHIRVVFYTKRFCRKQPLQAVLLLVAAVALLYALYSSSPGWAALRGRSRSRSGELFDAGGNGGGGGGGGEGEGEGASARKQEDPNAYKTSWVALPPSEFDCTLWKRRRMRDKLVHLSRRLGVPEHDDDKGGALDALANHAHHHVRANLQGPHPRLLEERDHLRRVLAFCKGIYGHLEEVGKDRRVISSAPEWSAFFSKEHQNAHLGE
ncbi:hypothetical protein T484DRAFT_1958391 [Baffinella frigidus]|nr:hypothetical protein T484DRAFT_1958391 [Cryptophyta sp. CCMP2293]